jgi:hypothetical protein
MKALLFAATALIALRGAASANLGDTPTQAESRYGVPQAEREATGPGQSTKFYLRDGMGIAVRFLDAKSQCESYLKPGRAEFSAIEIAALLSANAMGSEWQSVYKTATRERWELKSRDAMAVYSRADGTLVFSTKEFVRSSVRIKLIDPD